MRAPLGWLVDGAVLGTVMALVVTGWLVVLLLPGAGVDYHYSRLEDWGWWLFYATPSVLLGTGIGIVQGTLLWLVLRLRRFVPVALAPALFSWVGLGSGLVAAAGWLVLWAGLHQCLGGCLCIPDASDSSALYGSVPWSWGVGAMLVLPGFAVARVAAQTRGDRLRVLLGSCLAALVVVSLLWWGARLVWV